MTSKHGKRKRVEKPLGKQKRRKAENIKLPPAGSDIRRTAVSSDHLAWKEVALPDRLEDAEGFFGLEEIDDVEVVRDAENGKIEYWVGKNEDMVCYRLLLTSLLAASWPLIDEAGKDYIPSDSQSSLDSYSDWEGFGDEVSNEHFVSGGPEKQPKEAHENLTEDKPRKGKTRSSTEKLSVLGNGFEVLESLDEEEVDGKPFVFLFCSRLTI